MKKLILIVAALVLLSGCGETFMDSTFSRDKESVLDRLKDPESARFRQTYYVKTEGGEYLICGEVNSKNSYGGYGTYKDFLSFYGKYVRFGLSKIYKNNAEDLLECYREGTAFTW